MKVVPYIEAHMWRLDEQEGGAFISKNVTAVDAKALESQHAITGIHDGKVIAVAGLAPVWPGRALLWSYMGSNAGRHMPAIHKVALRMIESFEGDRIEADVDVDFEAGHRWIKMLGFELETARMRKYRPDGRDMAKYVRIR